MVRPAAAAAGTRLTPCRACLDYGHFTDSHAASQRRRFPDFVELDLCLQPHIERRAAGPGGAGSSAGFDANTLVLPVQVSKFYKNDALVVEQRRIGLQQFLNTAIAEQTPTIAEFLRLFFFASADPEPLAAAQ